MSNVEALIDVYDDEVPLIERVLEAFQKGCAHQRNLEGARRELIERFEEIGLVIQVNVYDSNVSGVYPFEAVIVGRCEKLAHGFDMERQRHAVVNDILGLGTHEPGKTLKFDPSELHRPGKGHAH